MQQQQQARSLWGYPGIAKQQYQTNGVQTWGVGSQPNSVPIQATGIIDALRLIHYGSITLTPGTGTIAADVLGPDNHYSNITLAPNAQNPIIQASGIGLRDIMLMKSGERKFYDYRDTANDDSYATAANPAAQVYTFPATGTGVPVRYAVDMPILQHVQGLGTVGYFPMQNNRSLMSLNFTPNSPTASTPYNVAGTVAGVSPYLITGNATALEAAPTLDVFRRFWTVPADVNNFPPFQYLSTWIEDAPQGAVGGASQVKYTCPANIGWVARLGVHVLDSNLAAGPVGYVPGTLAAANALQLVYDNNTALFQESEFEALTRQKAQYGASLPSGVFTWDLLGENLSLANTLDTFNVPNIAVILNFAPALGATSSVKILRQVISPLIVKAS